jgi:hypothetical protein
VSSCLNFLKYIYIYILFVYIYIYIYTISSHMFRHCSHFWELFLYYAINRNLMATSPNKILDIRHFTCSQLVTLHFTHTHTHTYIYTHTHIHTYIYTHIYIHTYTTYIYTHIYIYTHTHIYIHEPGLFIHISLADSCQSFVYRYLFIYIQYIK